MHFIKELPNAEKLQKDIPLTEQEQKGREKKIHEIQAVLSGIDKRKILIIGPCAADREDAVIEYVSRLAELEKNIRDRILLIPRIYTSKPRTTGEGYKGIIHNPYGDDYEDLIQGIVATRKLHIRAVRETGLYAADEMLYPEGIYYISDLLCYMAVGARSVEDQGHRMVASDKHIPVGLKNPVGGSKITLVNSIRAAQMAHRLIYRGWETETEGNCFAHGILRGYTDKGGKNHPNYHYEDIIEFHDLCYRNNISNMGVIIDCNHANSNKQYDEQMRIAKEVFGYCRENTALNSFIKGLMIESYLEDGSQIPGQGCYGKSITDPCLGWEKTEQLVMKLYKN